MSVSFSHTQPLTGDHNFEFIYLIKTCSKSKDQQYVQSIQQRPQYPYTNPIQPVGILWHGLSLSLGQGLCPWGMVVAVFGARSYCLWGKVSHCPWGKVSVFGALFATVFGARSLTVLGARSVLGALFVTVFGARSLIFLGGAKFFHCF